MNHNVESLSRRGIRSFHAVYECSVTNKNGPTLVKSLATVGTTCLFLLEILCLSAAGDSDATGNIASAALPILGRVLHHG